MFLRRQVTQDRVVVPCALAALELHEDEVPDLEVALLVRLRAAVDAELRAAVEVDLAARAARAGHAHRPVVVFLAAALDALAGQESRPELERLVVVVVDRGPQPLGVEAVAASSTEVSSSHASGMAPCFEVVAEPEVAAHLEERRVPAGLADFVDVGRAHDLLHARRARRRAAADHRESTA